MELTDNEIMDAMPKQLHEDLAKVCQMASDSIGVDVAGMFRVCLNRGIVDHCRAAIAADRAARIELHCYLDNDGPCPSPCVFDDPEAHAELTRRAEAKLTSARLCLQYAQGFADNVRGMKPPQEVQ